MDTGGWNMESYKQEFIEFIGLCFSMRLLNSLEVA